MPEKISISIGTVKADLNYSNESEKELIENFSKELNIEFNSILLQYGRMNETIILFFLLFKTQKEIFEINGDDYDLNSILKEISCFVNEKSNLDQQLITANIVKRNILKKGKTNNSDIVKEKSLKTNKQDIVNIINTIFCNTEETILKFNKKINKIK